MVALLYTHIQARGLFGPVWRSNSLFDFSLYDTSVAGRSSSLAATHAAYAAKVTEYLRFWLQATDQASAAELPCYSAHSLRPLTS